GRRTQPPSLLPPPRLPRLPPFPYTPLFRSVRAVSLLLRGPRSRDRPPREAARLGGLSSAARRSDRSPSSRAAHARGIVRLVRPRSEEHTSELQSRENLVCRLLLEKKKNCAG